TRESTTRRHMPRCYLAEAVQGAAWAAPRRHRDVRCCREMPLLGRLTDLVIGHDDRGVLRSLITTLVRHPVEPATAQDERAPGTRAISCRSQTAVAHSPPRLLRMFALSLLASGSALGCEGPVAPLDAPDVAGEWYGGSEQTEVIGGECAGDMLRRSPRAGRSMSITQAGGNLTVILSSRGLGGTSTWTGSIDSDRHIGLA